MKTFLFSNAMGAFTVLIVLLLSSERSVAQDLTYFPDGEINTYTLSLSNSAGSVMPDKLILIFDSTTLTFEFAQDGALTLMENKDNGGSMITSIQVSASSDRELPALSDRIENTLEESLVEEEIELKEWMLNPSEWKIE